MKADRNASSALGDRMSSPTDGRTLRRSRNRDAVINALLELVREGKLNPGAAQIAERAGVSHRSVFRYFDDLNDLVRTAIRQDFLEAEPLLEIASIGEGTLDVRAANLARARVALYERVYGTALLARMRSSSLPDIEDEQVTVAMFKREQIRQHFADELEKLPESASENIVDACLVLTSFDSFDIHRRTLGQDNYSIATSWTTYLVALLSN